MEIFIETDEEYVDVKLTYEHNGIKFALCPECPEAMRATFPRGKFDSDPSNGAFWFQ